MKVIIEVIRGINAGEKYEYYDPSRVYIGRKNDCGIVLPDPEKNISRYHCLLKISAENVLLQDLGSTNGTYLNGKKIGRRDGVKIPEEVKDDLKEDYILHDGDEIGIGRKCTLKCRFRDHSKIVDDIIEQMRRDGFDIVSTLKESCLPDGYEEERLLGKGGMGEVWEVTEIKTGEHFALKTLLPRVKSDEEVIMKFLREAEIGSAVSHKNVVRTYRTWFEEGAFYILMDLCRGGNVEDLMKRNNGRLSLKLATWIILQVLCGLDHIHNVDVKIMVPDTQFGGNKEVYAKGIVHRDLKPANILLSDDRDTPVAKIADFGLAKAFDISSLSCFSKTGDVIGTPQFMPHQQAVNCKYSKPEVDVWAAAACYYYMLTGEYPKNFNQDKNEWMITVDEKAVPIRERNESIPVALAEVIDNALDDAVEISYATAAGLKEAIMSVLPGELKSAFPDL